MVLLTVIVSIIFSVFSTAVMSYIAMATPIGPWIAPTLVLVALLLFRFISRNATPSVVLVTIAGSIGGILATGCAFSFPTVYFLDPILFGQWMAQPGYFAMRLSALAASAGSFGFLLANLFEYKLCVQDALPFPIATLVYKMVSATNQLRKSLELMVGFVVTSIFCFLQDGLCSFQGVIPKGLNLIAPLVVGGLRIPCIGFDLWPMLWAIGFITGHVIAIPLIVGALSRLCVVDPINGWWFSALSSAEFTFAFCSGMVLLGAIESALRVPKMLRQCYAWARGMRQSSYDARRMQKMMQEVVSAESVALLGVASVLLVLLGFALHQVVYTLLFTAIFSYQMMVIAAKWGMAPLGRFATFVMLPGMLFIKMDMMQAVFVALFVEVCGGVAYDLLCGRMIARKASLEARTVKRYQYLGLCVSLLLVGVVFWCLVQACSLGSAALFAYKAQSRALLINALLHGHGFNSMVLGLGLIFSFVLGRLKLNPLLVLGGILMPLNLSLGLIFGGLIACSVKNRETWDPFWSGVFAANSVWMLFKAVL